MTVQSVPRYPEVREDGSMWVPLAPPPPLAYRQLSESDAAVVGKPAVVSYSTEWLVGMRVLTDPYEQHAERVSWVVKLCDEGAWYDFQRHGVSPNATEMVEASVGLVYLIEHGYLANR